MLAGAQLYLLDVDTQHFSLLQKHLAMAGHYLTCFSIFDEVLAALKLEQPTVLLLVPPVGMLHSPDWLDLLRADHPLLPILVLLDSHSYHYRSLWLNHGADAVLSRPYALEELQAWISSLLRRSIKSQTPSSGLLAYADLTVDVVARQVRRSGQQIKLTIKEFDLLVYFLRNPEQVLPRLQILHAVWGQSWRGDDNLLDVYIRYLRKKVDVPHSTSLIQTVRGIGFALRDPEKFSS